MTPATGLKLIERLRVLLLIFVFFPFSVFFFVVVVVTSCCAAIGNDETPSRVKTFRIVKKRRNKALASGCLQPRRKESFEGYSSAAATLSKGSHVFDYRSL